MNLPPDENTINNKAVFIDKDGTLIVDVPYNIDPSLIRLSPEAVSGLRLLAGHGYKLIVVSNQSGVAMGYFTESDLRKVEIRLNELLKEERIAIGGFYYCPHHPRGNVDEYSINCKCRKPNDGMLRKAAVDHNIDLWRSWMVGDILDDIEAGNRAGCRSILVGNNHETEWKVTSARIPFAMVRNIDDAANLIIKTEHAFVDQLP